MTLDYIKKLFKFSWAQAFSDHNGKSSIIPVAGWYLVFIGGVVLLIGSGLKDSNSMMYGVAESTIGAGLIGYRKRINGGSEGAFPQVTEPDPPPEPAPEPGT